MPRPSPLKAAAAARGVTLAQVAEATGYSPRTVGAVSSGQTAPWPEFRRRMAAYFGQDVLGPDPAVVETAARLANSATPLTDATVAEVARIVAGQST